MLTRQNGDEGATKQACKKASLKIAIIAEAHQGLGDLIGNLVHSHDKLLSAAFAAATFLVLNFSTLFRQSQQQNSIYSIDSFDKVHLKIK